MEHGRCIISQGGFVNSFDVLWSEWSRITSSPDSDHPNGTYFQFQLDRQILEKAAYENTESILGESDGKRAEKNGAKKPARLHFPYPPLAICPWASEDDNMKIFR